MRGAGSEHPTWEPLRQALEAHIKESAGGEGYVLGDWVILSHVVDLDAEDDGGGEYVMASSSQVPHIVEGILAQISLFRSQESPDDD